VTGPRQGGDTPFSPARRPRGRLGRDELDAEDDADLDRGRTTALLGALGRMQLRLDVLAQQQPEGFERILELLERLDERLARLEEQSGREQGPQSAQGYSAVGDAGPTREP
jgi:hypothetical protein